MRVVGLLMMLACTNSGTNVRVVLTADMEALVGVDTLDVRVETDDGPVQAESFRVRPNEGWRFVANLRPRGGDDSRRYRLTFELRGEQTSRQRVLSGYVSNARRELRLHFDASCRDVLCEGDMSCIGGGCVPACARPTRPGEVERSVFEACSLTDAGIDDASSDGGTCEPGPDRCVGGNVERCVEGRVEIESCSTPCDLEPPACRTIHPSNFGATLIDELSGRDLTIPEGERWIIDTTPGADPVVQGFDLAGVPLEPDVSELFLGAVTSIDGASLFVLGVRSLIVSRTATLRAIGSRPFVIRASRDVIVRGTVSVASRTGEIGAGGTSGGLAEGILVPAEGFGAGESGQRTMGQFVFSGGGGGSNGGRGGDGGTGLASIAGDEDVPGGRAGMVIVNPTITPLIGGSGGGPGGPQQRGGAGGHGGGAVQITADGMVLIELDGSIDASGGGGGGGPENGSGGGGGGSGGSILVEGTRVELRGAIGANGGGGGSAHSNGVPMDGNDAVPFDGAAPGGRNSRGLGNGGEGSWLTDPGQRGFDERDAGGGGGGAGRIRINDLSSVRGDFEARVSPSTVEGFTVGPVDARVPR